MANWTDFYKKILSSAQGLQQTVNPYVQNLGNQVKAVPQLFNPKNNVGGYLAQTLPYQSVQNVLKPISVVQNIPKQIQTNWNKPTPQLTVSKPWGLGIPPWQTYYQQNVRPVISYLYKQTPILNQANMELAGGMLENMVPILTGGSPEEYQNTKEYTRNRNLNLPLTQKERKRQYDDMMQFATSFAMMSGGIQPITPEQGARILANFKKTSEFEPIMNTYKNLAKKYMPRTSIESVDPEMNTRMAAINDQFTKGRFEWLKRFEKASPTEANKMLIDIGQKPIYGGLLGNAKPVGPEYNIGYDNRLPQVPTEGTLKERQKIVKGEGYDIRRPILPSPQSQGYKDIRGFSAKNPEEVGSLLKDFRNPKSEVFHVVYVKNGIVVGHNSIGSDLASSVAIPDKEIIFGISDSANRLKADSVYIAHNHPSGYAYSSTDDILFYNRLKKTLSGKLKASITMDHDEMDVIKGSNAPEMIPVDFGKSFKATGVAIHNENILINYAKTYWNPNEGKMGIFVVNTQNQPIAYKAVNIKGKSLEHINRVLRQTARESGGSGVFMITNGQDLAAHGQNLSRLGAIDVILTKGDGQFTSLRNLGVALSPESLNLDKINLTGSKYLFEKKDQSIEGQQNLGLSQDFIPEPPKEGYKRYDITVQGQKMYADVGELIQGIPHIEFIGPKNNPISTTGYLSHVLGPIGNINSIVPKGSNLQIELQKLGEELAMQNTPNRNKLVVSGKLKSPGFGEEPITQKIKVKEKLEKPKKPEVVKIKQTNDRLAEIDNELKKIGNIKEKAKLLKERETILNKANPQRVETTNELIETYKANQLRNQQIAKVSEEITPINRRLAELNKEIPMAGAKAKGKSKGSPEVMKMSGLVDEKNELLAKQKELVSQRDVGVVKEEPKQIVVQKPKPEVEPVDIENVKAGAYALSDKLGDEQTKFIDDFEKGKNKDTPLGQYWTKITKRLREWAMQTTGKNMGNIKDYFPHVSLMSDSQITRDIGDNLLDMVAKNSYSPFTTRTGTNKDYVKDIKYAVDEYIKAVDYEANKIAIEAQRKGISPESEKLIEDTAKKMGENIKESGVSGEDLVGMARDVAKNEKLPMDDIPVKNVTWPQRKLKDFDQTFDELGIKDYLHPLINYVQEAGILMDQIALPLKSGDYDTALTAIKAKYPSLDIESARSKLLWVERKGGNPIWVASRMVEKLAKQEGMKTLLEVVPRLRFQSGVTRDYVNSTLNYVLGEDARTANTIAKLQAVLRKSTTLGFLGLNPNPAILNLLEPRRLLGVMNPVHFAKAIEETNKGLISGRRATTKYGFEPGRYEERLLESKNGESLVKNLKGLGGQAENAIMKLFTESERLKDDMFLNAFEIDGKAKGLTGEELNRYVINNTRKYAIHGDKWGTLGMFDTGIFGMNGDLTKSIFQFAQYPIRDLGILQSELWGFGKEPREALTYLMAYVLTTYAIYKMYESAGLNGINAALSVPVGIDRMLMKDPTSDRYGEKSIPNKLWEAFRNISPNTSLVADIGAFIYEYFNNNVDGDRVPAYIEQRLVKDLFRRIPAGGQVMRTYGIPGADNIYGGYIKNLQEGYQPNTAGNVRYPVVQEGIGETIKGAAFGSPATQYGSQFWKDYQQGTATALNPDQTAQYQKLIAEGKQDEAVQYWKDIYEGKKKYRTVETPAYNKLDANGKAVAESIPDQDPNDFESRRTKYTLLLQYPDVYNYKKEVAVNKADGNVDKIDPLYTFPKSEVVDYMRYQTLYPGSDKSNTYKKNPVIKKLGEARTKFYELNPILDAQGNVVQGSDAPRPSAYVQQQMDLKNWNDPQVKAYLDLNTAYKNKILSEAGLPLIEPYQPYKRRMYFRSIRHPKVKFPKLKVKKPKKIKLKKAKVYKLKKPSGLRKIKLTRRLA